MSRVRLKTVALTSSDASAYAFRLRIGDGWFDAIQKTMPTKLAIQSVISMFEGPTVILPLER
jgi:hypothetical protein